MTGGLNVCMRATIARRSTVGNFHSMSFCALVGQYEKRKLGRTYVAAPPDDNRVYGYHTLAAGSVSAHHLSAKAGCVNCRNTPFPWRSLGG